MKKLFELKEEHLKLLKNMQVDWNDCEFGAPSIDCKRPYGNSDVYNDIAEILEIDGFEDSEGRICFSREHIDLMDKLHKEMGIVLQIILVTEKFEPGIYIADEYKNNWHKESQSDKKIFL